MDQTREIKNTLAGEIAFTHWANTDKMFLFDSTFVPDQNSTLADFTAAKIPAANVVAFVLASTWVAGLDVVGDWTNIYNGVALFTPAGTATFPFIAGGWYITDTGETGMKAFKTFDGPIAFNTALDTLLIKPSVSGTMDGESDDEFTAGP
jgi:hypothetical protein